MSDSGAISVERRASVREDLPSEVREMLTTRMRRHGREMTELMVNVLLLDYALTEQLAKSLADEPTLARPAASEKGTLNALLPASFFVHQDALTDSSRLLAIAARMNDDRRLVDAFARVTKACVGCHAVYLYEDEDDPSLMEPGENLHWLEDVESCGGFDGAQSL